MKNKNKVNLMGFVGKVNLLNAAEGKSAVLKFTLATNKQWLDSLGNQKKHTQWHNIVVFGKQAIALSEKLNLSAGDYVDVDGSLEYGEYEKAEKTIYTTEIIANNINGVGVLAQKEQ